MIYGYARVSTGGQDLENQIEILEEQGCDYIYSEKITGTKLEREEFQKLLSVLKDGDKLIVCKLDRFARSATDAILTIRALVNRGVSINILNMGWIEDTITGRLMLTVFSGFAEFERDMIVERTQAGKAAARKKPDFREGRPPVYKRATKEHALELLQDHSYAQVEAKTGMSVATLVRAKRKQKAKQLQNKYDMGE